MIFQGLAVTLGRSVCKQTLHGQSPVLECDGSELQRRQLFNQTHSVIIHIDPNCGYKVSKTHI